MKIYENIEAERDRIETCIRRFGWTSDHNLDWFLQCAINEEGRPVFAGFEDGSGLLAYRYPTEWSIWSDPLCDRKVASRRVSEFAKATLTDEIKKLWLLDVAENIRPELLQNPNLGIGDIDYSLQWPVLHMKDFDPSLSGGHFKEIRNARNKFYREHSVEIADPSHVDKKTLCKIVDDWKNVVSKRPDIYELKYKRVINNNFRGFKTARVLVVDGAPVGLNAGYEIPNHTGRFAGIIGIHNYSIRDLGLMSWLEDLEWIKNAGYQELDMQGSENDGGLKFKMQFVPVIERRTDTFPIYKK